MAGQRGWVSFGGNAVLGDGVDVQDRFEAAVHLVVRAHGVVDPELRRGQGCRNVINKAVTQAQWDGYHADADGFRVDAMAPLVGRHVEAALKHEERWWLRRR